MKLCIDQNMMDNDPCAPHLEQKNKLGMEENLDKISSIVYRSILG